MHRALVVAFCLAAGLVPAGDAHANGAFPESFQLVLPADRPGEIVLGTNFGLMLSDDDGATWTWTCEMDATQDGSLYAVGAPPADRLYSVSTLAGLARSDDGSCTWQTATWPLERPLTTDFFPDAADPTRVLGIAQDLATGSSQRVFRSDDGGASFGPLLFEASLDDTVTGVESARSDPQTIYVALASSPGVHPRLVRSRDGGKTWMAIDVEPFLGPNNFRIVSVDPSDPKTIILRVLDPAGESLAISRDGGDTFARPVTLEGGLLRAFARLDDGTLLAGGAVLGVAHGFRSTDGGTSFQDWSVPHLQALGTRGGKLYAAAANYTDGWAVGVSTDAGLTFTPLARYDEVKRITACAQAACYAGCLDLAGRQVWDRAVCDVGQAQPPPSSGCGCGVTPARGSGLEALAAAAAGLALAARRRRVGAGDPALAGRERSSGSAAAPPRSGWARTGARRS
jgi:MYXO-CTERM domain-containing protein